MNGPVRAVLVRANGEHTYTDIARDTDAGLTTLQQLVGGLIELVPLDRSAYIIVNETGLLDGLPVNELATRALIALRPEMAGTLLVGDAVFLGFTSAGNETHCPTRIWDLIVRLADDAGIPHGGPCTYPQTRSAGELESDDDDARRDARADAMRDGL